MITGKADRATPENRVKLEREPSLGGACSYPDLSRTMIFVGAGQSHKMQIHKQRQRFHRQTYFHANSIWNTAHYILEVMLSPSFILLTCDKQYLIKICLQC